MKSSNRLLIGFAIAVVALVGVAVGLALTLGSGQPGKLLDENTPEGSVQRFLLAVQERDFTEACRYMSITEDCQVWWSRRGFLGERSWKATLGQSRVNGDEATVEVMFDVFRPGGPFEDPVRTNRATFFLKKVDGMWRIKEPLELWWLY